MRRPPGDLMMMIIFSEMMLSIHWFSHGLYKLIKETDPDSNSLFCQVNSHVAFFFACNDMIYNFNFIVNTFIHYKSGLKQIKINHKLLHLIIWLTSFVFMIYQ